MKNTILLGILLLVFAVIIRVMYNSYNDVMYFSADTFSYYSIGQQILKNPFPFIINDQRSFIYPVFLHANMILAGYYNPKYMSTQFVAGLIPIYKNQTFLALIGLLVLYFGLLLYGFSRIFSFLFSTFTATNILLFAWEKVVLTESMYIALLQLLLFTLIFALKKPSTGRLILLFFVFIVSFFLRPIQIGLPYVILPILALFFHKKTVWITSILLLSLYSLLVIYIYVHNTIFFHYTGISRNTDINLLGKILQFNLPVENASGYTFLYENVSRYREKGGEPQPYRFLEFYDLSIYQDPKGRFNLLKEFNSKVIGANLLFFTFKALVQIPKAILETSELTIPFHSGHPLSPFFNILHRVFLSFQWVTLTVLPGFPISVYLFLKQKTRESTFILLLGIISWYQIFISVFFSYGEFGRLITPVQPILYLFSFYWWGKLIQHLSKVYGKVRNYYSNL